MTTCRPVSRESRTGARYRHLRTALPPAKEPAILADPTRPGMCDREPVVGDGRRPGFGDARYGIPGLELRWRDAQPGSAQANSNSSPLNPQDDRQLHTVLTHRRYDAPARVTVLADQGSMRSIVLARSNDVIRPMPVLSAQATRYASAKSDGLPRRPQWRVARVPDQR